MLKRRGLIGKNLNPIGLGCMNVSHGYGDRIRPEDAVRLIQAAMDQGVEHFDTATLYGFGDNERVVGEALKGRRHEVFLASKCGMAGVDGVRVIDGRPETLKRACEASLQRLQTDVIDLYYLHRWDKSVPIEDSVGALGELVTEGKIRGLGLSEVSAATLRKAHSVHPVSAVQSEYSLWARDVDIAVKAACAELEVALVAFSPLGRGFLAGAVTDAEFPAGDLRLILPRFQSPRLEANLTLYKAFENLATLAGLRPAQLALAWVLAQGEHIHVIPGTTSLAHLSENGQTPIVDAAILEAAGRLITPQKIHGARYPAGVQVEIDTEACVTDGAPET